MQQIKAHQEKEKEIEQLRNKVFERKKSQFSIFRKKSEKSVNTKTQVVSEVPAPVEVTGKGEEDSEYTFEKELDHWMVQIGSTPNSNATPQTGRMSFDPSILII